MTLSIGEDGEDEGTSGARWASWAWLADPQPYPEGDRKGPHPATHRSRPYKDYVYEGG